MHPSATIDHLLAERLRRGTSARTCPDPARIAPDDLRALISACLADDLRAGLCLCRSLQARGVGIPVILGDLVTPVARHLGELWIDDECDFVRVTVATDLLKRMVLTLSEHLEAHGTSADSTPQILLLPVPGSQHTLGLLIVAARFRLARWAVTTAPQISLDELRGLAGTGSFDIVGFSVGSVAQEAMLARAVALWRSACGSSGRPVLLGGPAVLVDPGLPDRVGADASAIDAEQALHVASGLLRSLATQAA